MNHSWWAFFISLAGSEMVQRHFHTRTSYSQEVRMGQVQEELCYICYNYPCLTHKPCSPIWHQRARSFLVSIFFLEFSAHHYCVRLLVTKLSSAQSANHVSIDLKINYKYGSFFFPLRIPSDFYGSQLYPQRDTCYYLFYNIVGST